LILKNDTPEYEYLYPGPGRVYKYRGEYYPGITSVLNGFKIKKSDWVHDAAKIGTICHNDISKRRDGKAIDKEIMIWTVPQKEVYAAIRRFRQMWARINVTPIDVEIPIIYADPDNKYIRYSSRIDLIYKQDGYGVLSDIKTGNWYDHYPMQLAAAYQAVKDEYDIQRCSILRCDINLDRNPDAIPEVILFDIPAIEELIPEFNKMCIEYNKLLEKWIANFKEEK